ncbi:hypothetical protein CA13_25550 [Planctomycetes bacterium CA13]|uniref:DUF4272 domain-containing protein n=1 Tax=Novipirellula herctigrandis TaxID=2527986 RepID=A0A5C5Z152_9BACT|nr:hypothetical protein CA13_25550 [Planctomycetes bacterium CA13]
MWHTSRGDRTLISSEASLVSLAIDTMIDALLVHLDEEDESIMPPECQSGIAVYDVLTASQRVGLLHDVARYLLTETEKTLSLSAATEAAIAALYIEVRDQLAIEIDLYSENPIEGLQTDSLRWRMLVLAAYLSLNQIPDNEEQTERNQLEFNDISEDDMDSEPFGLPAIDSDDLEHWERLIESLTDAVLWDRDYELAESFLDVDPGVSNQRRRLLGIDNDYFTYVAPDPRPEQVMQLVWDTRDILRSKPR